MKKNTTPLEEEEQTCLFDWASVMAGRYTGLRLLHAIPNGGLRSKTEASRMRAAGVKSGVPDIFLPVPCQGMHGLYIELKRRQGGIVSDEQTWWINELRRMGYRSEVCRGWDEARDVIADYMGIKRTWT